MLIFSSPFTVFISLTHSGEAFAFFVPMKLFISVTMTLSLVTNCQMLFYLTYWQHLTQLIVPSSIKHYLYNSSMSHFLACPSLLCYFSMTFSISPTSKCWGGILGLCFCPSSNFCLCMFIPFMFLYKLIVLIAVDALKIYCCVSSVQTTSH